MPALTIRNLSDDIHRALKARAASHGRSTEAEVRDILAAAVKPEGRKRVGQALWELGRELNLTDEDVAVIEASRDRTPAEPMSFDE